MSELIINREIQELLPELSEAEYKQLEENIISAGGARDPIVVWKEENIIIDGHHRYHICDMNGLSFSTKMLSFPDKASVFGWMVKNQEGRRNMTPNAISYLRGKHLSELPEGERTQAAKALAESAGVTDRTVWSDKAFAEEVDELPADEKKEVLQRKKRTRNVGEKKPKAEELWYVLEGKPYRAAKRELHRILAEMEAISEDPVRGKIIATKFTRIKHNLDEAIDAISQCEPVEECNGCTVETAAGCNKCFGTGFLSRAAKESRDR